MLYPVARQVVRTGFRTIWPTTVTGVHHVPKEGAVIIASNHLSFLDSIVIPAVVPRPVKFIAKQEYFTGSGVRGAVDRVFFTAVGAIGVDRNAKQAAKISLDKAGEVLDAGYAFGIYPEGTRSRTGLLYRGKTGVAWLALDKGVPVVPVGLVGTAAAMQAHNNKVRPFKRLGAHFGQPIHPQTYADLKPGVARREMTAAIMDSIATLSGQQRAECYAPSSSQ